jgi:hypothetical protein
MAIRTLVAPMSTTATVLAMGAGGGVGVRMMGLVDIRSIGRKMFGSVKIHFENSFRK